MSQERPLYLEMGAIKMKGWDTSQGRPFYLEVGAMKMKGVGHVPRETSLPRSGCHKDEGV